MNEQITETLALYALGVLTSDESRNVEQMLDRHPEYRLILKEYLQSADLIAQDSARGTMQAPAELKHRIHQSLDTRYGSHQDTAIQRPASPIFARSRYSVTRWLVPSLAASTIFLAGFAISQQITLNQFNQPEATFSQTDGMSISRSHVAQFEVADTMLEGLSGEVILKGDQALLVLEQLPAPPDGKEWRVYAVHTDDSMDSMAGIDHAEDEMMMPMGAVDKADTIGFKIFLQDINDISDPSADEAVAIGMFA